MAVVYAKSKKIELIPTSLEKLEELELKEELHLLVSTPINEIKKVMYFASKHILNLGIIPHEEQKELKSTFDLKLVWT